MTNREIAIYYMKLAVEAAEYEDWLNMDYMIETSIHWQNQVNPLEDQQEFLL